MALDGRFILVNRGSCELLGYSEEQLVTMTPADISHPDEVDLVTRAIATSARTNERIFHVERRYVNADVPTTRTTCRTRRSSGAASLVQPGANPPFE
jgi:PAS domain S-box-containing protein